MEDCVLSGWIADLSIFNVPEFGLRASFKIERVGQPPIVCAIAGDVAREFVLFYRQGDIVVISGMHEPRPSTASVNTPWVGRFRVRTVQLASVAGIAVDRVGTVRSGCENKEVTIEKPQLEPAFGSIPSSRRR